MDLLSLPDGLHILARTPLSQLAEDETLLNFADGLILEALAHTTLPDGLAWTLTGALYHPGPQTNPLMVALLVLDAELRAVIDEEQRILPLPGFLTYRASLFPDKFPCDTLRLPPLNQDGHYLLSLTDDGFCFAVRLDLHPELKVAGHVRIAVSSPTRSPLRLQATEYRLDRQVLNRGLIEAAVTAGSEELLVPLTKAEQARLIARLNQNSDEIKK